ncbi:cytochrome P450 monooxygenase [Striga asiatica]|uniref:Cytochrome P450 monooxygenase n=1 Tax=Striga asiatica TaxID=4170 RepID=A0A5A7PBU1_STRAF|nr:cytochrome P450 monooxygenase [Striga asiatica]
MFSGDMGSSGGVGELRELIGRLVELVMKPNAADYLPWLRLFDVQGIRREITRLYGRVHELLWDVIKRRVGERAGGPARRRDFLDVLLDYAEENVGHGGAPTQPARARQAQTRNFRHQHPARKTCRGTRHTPSRVLRRGNKRNLEGPPGGPLLIPHLTEERANIGPYTISEGTEVLMNVWSIQRDPAYLADPTSFRPKRFVGSDVDIRGRDCRFIPFGTGRRICLGSGLAVRMVSLMLANLVHGFDWEFPDGMRPEDLDMTDGFGIVLWKMEPLVAIL